MWEDHPLIGVGPGGYPRSYREYAEQIGIRVQLADRQPHNLYLGLAAETGLLGLACFLGVVGVTLATLWRARRRMLLVDPARAAMLSGFILSVVAYLTTAVFLHLSFQRYFWLLMALAGAATYLASRSPAIPAPRLRPERDPRAAVPCAARSTGSHPSLP